MKNNIKLGKGKYLSTRLLDKKAKKPLLPFKKTTSVKKKLTALGKSY